MLVAMTLPSSAYHVDGTGTNGYLYEWEIPDDFLILCEHPTGAIVTFFPNGDPANSGVTPFEVGTGTPRSGQGGLCYMAPGYDSSVTGGNNDVRSNGKLPDGSAASGNGVPAGGASEPDYDTWIALDMCQYGTNGEDFNCDTTDNAVAWTSQSDLASCDIPVGSHLVYREIHAYWLDDGYVNGFVDATTLATGVEAGSYALEDTGVTAPTVGPSCDEPYPHFIVSGDLSHNSHTYV